jgi:hypothetical protein
MVRGSRFIVLGFNLEHRTLNVELRTESGSIALCGFRFRFFLYVVRFISGRGEGEPSPEPF